VHLLPDADPTNGCIDFTRAIENLFARIKPDVVCYDLNPLPWLTLLSPFPVPEVFITNFFLTRQEQFTTLQDQSFQNHGSHWNQLRETKGMVPILSAKQLYERGRVLYADPLDIVTQVKLIIPDSYVIGPCSWEPELLLPEPIKKLTDILFVALGSTGPTDIPDSLIENIASVCQTTATIMLHAKKQITAANKDIYLYNLLPSTKVLAKTKATLTHGGTGTVYQALAMGVPVFTLPMHRNQEILGQILENKNLGILISSDDYFLELDVLASQWQELQKNCARVAANIAKVDAPVEAAKLIHAVI
jgi:UDP:flavonoid glycosyltransferase YjiC (YdhE family)